ncbi:hypothetical protein D3C78_1003770 [compost metagenome]
MRHHAGHAVDHTQGHQAFIGEGLDVRPQGREMVRVMDCQHGDPGTAGLFHQQLTGGGQGRLGKTAFGVNPQVTTGNIGHFRHGLAVDPATGQGRHITGNTEHTMAMGAVALGTGAVEGQSSGHRFTGAMTDENTLQQGLQLGKSNVRDSSVGACGHLKLPYWIWNGQQR